MSPRFRVLVCFRLHIHVALSSVTSTAVLEQFRNGQYNTIVATCVGEEGLDIGVCFFMDRSLRTRGFFSCIETCIGTAPVFPANSAVMY